MGWFQDYASFINQIPGLGMASKVLTNAAANNERDAAKIQSFYSGLPFIGGIYRGIDQARYADDYYENTGMVPKYPSMAPGYSGLSSGIGNAVLGASAFARGSGGYNVKEGTRDLLSFYNYAYQ